MEGRFSNSQNQTISRKQATMQLFTILQIHLWKNFHQYPISGFYVEVANRQTNK